MVLHDVIKPNLEFSVAKNVYKFPLGSPHHSVKSCLKFVSEMKCGFKFIGHSCNKVANELLYHYWFYILHTVHASQYISEMINLVFQMLYFRKNYSFFFLPLLFAFFVTTVSQILY